MSSSTSSKSKAIKTKLANLINTLPRDICIKTRITNWSFDLQKYFNIEEIENFLDKSNEILTLSNSKGRDVLEEELNSFHTAQSFLNYLSENEIFLAKTRIEKLEHNFEKFKDSTIQLILSKTSTQNRKLDAIIKKNKIIDENTGIYSLYLGTNFISGLTIMGTQVNAPLFLYPIEISRKNDVYTIRHVPSMNNFVINEKLLSLLSNEYKANLSIIDIANDCYKTKSIDPIVNIFKNNFKVNVEISDIDTGFIENRDVSSFVGFKIQKSYVCGIYEPTGGALKYDLEQLIKMNVDPFDSIEGFTKNKFINDEIHGQNLVSIGRPLNIYQKYAIRSSLNQNTIIFGPPGTGKSEVITNIIINAMLREKSILLAAEKRVALDVIIDRLGDIANFTLYIANLKSKSEFYNKILFIADKLENMLSDTSIDSQQININSYLENTIHERDLLKDKFNNLSWILKKVDSNGTTFNDYMQLLNQVDYRILKFVKENNSLDFLNGMVYYYSFLNIETFFTKMNEYKNFLIENKISPEFIPHLKKQKEELISFDVKYNFLSFLRLHNKNIPNLKAKFIEFLENAKLITNRHFLSSISKNPWLLKKQKIWLTELQSSSNLFNRDLLEYMISKASKINSFVSKMNNLKAVSQFQNLFNTFIANTKLNSYIHLDGDLNDEECKEYFNIFKMFSKIEENNNEYLLNLFDLKDNFAIDQNIVLMYFNQWLNEQYILELGEKQLVFFSSEDLINFSAISHISNDEYATISKIITFENEIIGNNKILETDLWSNILSYRGALINEANNVTSIIATHCLNILKLRLFSLDEKTKQRIREVFSIARRDAKNNVPIKEFITNYYNELKIIFPIWISIPELISQSLPLEKNIFDYGIFDEASQIFMERAYPIVYRCTIKIVAGDDKQLKPTSFFANRAENESQNYEYADNDQVDSLLDRAKVSLWPTYHLRNHYRSNHRDLIQFSNDYIYDNNLEFVNRNGITKHAIEVVNVESVYDDGVNKEEATTVYELLMQNINKYGKIIVVTFGIKQSAYIEQLILKNMSLSPQIFEKYTNGDLIVCSLENVQGNEGDLIILSMTYGKDALGSFRANFGPVFMDGGINRLNVAITRAKEKMIIVKSFLASEMSININNPNAKLFYQFINYCDYLENESTNKNILGSFIEHKIISEQISGIVNKFVSKNDRYEIVSNYDIGSRIIDFAILDAKTKETKLAIIINKFKNNTTIQDMFEIIDQYYFIMDRGYKCYCIDEYYWIKNQETAAKKLMQQLNDL